uniref:Uncharacterized protein n=1 Tax=Anolis carolinensis TaxID=28377 RepID=A0A803TY59_ANOCA
MLSSTLEEEEKCLGMPREASGGWEPGVGAALPQQDPNPATKMLLEAIMKNGSAAGSGVYCQTPANSSDQNKPNNIKDSSATAARENGKTYTKDQVESIKQCKKSL